MLKRICSDISRFRLPFPKTLWPFTRRWEADGKIRPRQQFVQSHDLAKPRNALRVLAHVANTFYRRNWAMLVYGDPEFRVSLSLLLEKCQSRILRMNSASLDDLRSLLIFTGQIEQAIADSRLETIHQLSDPSAFLTDRVADCFYRQWNASGSLFDREILVHATDNLAKAFASAPSTTGQTVTVKIPEGFAFYALFPEQYCVAALDWARHNSNRNEAIVVGLRSIGTTLSAIVKATLSHTGWKVRRFTVRPTGHPFQRQLTLDAVPKHAECPVLIVDEGPGISGSSMAAVAQAFLSAGFGNISFLPGHGNEPGMGASTNVREIWRRVPRYVAPLEDVKWNRLSLEQSLLAQTEVIAGDAFSCDRVENMGAGLWRKLFHGDKNELPASPPQFERMKFLCLRRKGTSVLWKFAGLHGNDDCGDACEAAFRRLSILAEKGHCPAPLGAYKGFLAIPWIAGAPLKRADGRDSAILDQIGHYILEAARPPISPRENQAAIKRLADMLYGNTKESLGERYADKVSAFVDAALDAEVIFAYGDGHLAPHEWIRTREGTIFKVDAEGHAGDHTLIGEQSLLWDIAGVFVEWDLNPETAALFLQTIEGKGMRMNFEALTFYRAAYAAFRVGLFSLGLAQVSDEEEKSRFARARAFYLKHLAGVLKPEAELAQTAH